MTCFLILRLQSNNKFVVTITLMFIIMGWLSSGGDSVKILTAPNILNLCDNDGKGVKCAVAKEYRILWKNLWSLFFFTTFSY